MFIVHVHVQVKPESIDAFRDASLANARHSVQELGIARFDVIQQADDPTRFVLVEVLSVNRSRGTAQRNRALSCVARRRR